MIYGLILAGGYSSRAKTNKLLLEVNGKPLISLAIDSLKDSVDQIVVVTGRYDKELRPLLDNVKVIYNANYVDGMFSSVLTGISLVDNDVLILPGDIANVSKEAIEKIIANKGMITIPMHNGETGHPLFLNKEMVHLLKQEDKNSNLREFINKHINKVNYVEVDDSFINFDIDTIEDFNRLLEKRKELAYEG